MTVGLDPHIILSEEMLKSKKDGSDKDEGKLTGSKRLIKKLHKELNILLISCSRCFVYEGTMDKRTFIYRC